MTGIRAVLAGFAFLAIACMGLEAHGQQSTTITGPKLPKEQAVGILNRYYKLLHGAQTICFVEEASAGNQTMRTEHWLMRPAMYRSISTATNGSETQELRSYMVGKVSYTVDPKGKTCTEMKRYEGSPFLNGFEPFNQKERPKYTLTGVVRQVTFKGSPAYAIETGEQSIPGSMVSVFVDAHSLVPLGWQYAVGQRAEVYDYRTVRLGDKMKPEDFAWKPPADYKITRFP